MTLSLLWTLSACWRDASPCEAPEPVGHDPVIVDGLLDVNLFRVLGGAGSLVHLIDLAVDADAGRLYGGGTGGLWVFETGPGGQPDYKGNWNDQFSDTFSRVAVLPDDHVAVLDRSTGDLSASPEIERFNGVRVLDVAQPNFVQEVATIELPDVSFLAASGDLLYLLRHQGLLEIHDLGDPSAPRLVGELEGLGNPRALTLPDDQGRAWIADSVLGLVALDLLDPAAPALVSTVETAGSPVDLGRTDHQLVLALGSAGVEVLTLDGAEATSLGVVETVGTATQVSMQDGLVWVASVDGVEVLRQRSGALPEPHGFEPTERFSLCVEPVPDRQGAAWGCGWSDLLTLQADRTVRAPQAVLDSDVVRIAEGTQQATLGLRNRGGADLHVTQVAAAIEDFEGAATDPVLAPGAQSQLALLFERGFTPDVELCVASDDPGQPIRDLLVSTGDELTDLGVGTVAPDFSLPDLESTWHSLSDHRGQPVLLVWFATW